MKPEFELAKSIPGTSQLERVKAARAYLSTINDQARHDAAELHAFMAVFHPEVPADKVRDMVRDRNTK